jgi:hypothetical protein
MSSKVLVAIAIAGNCAVAAATYAVRGWSAPGAHAVARNTARFSALWFVVALAAPGLARVMRNFPRESTLVRSFVGAHLIHFSTVLALLVGFESAHLREHPGQAVAVVSIGFSVVLLLGVTASRSAPRVGTVINRVTLYAVFLIFFAAFVRHPLPLRAISMALGLALVLRLAARGFSSRSAIDAEKSRSAAQS